MMPPGLRKRWLFLLPSVFITYSLAYLDRANYGFGAAAGLAKTLRITDSQSALLGALFFLGYFFFQIPGAAYARRKSARFLVFWALVGWGTMASLTGVISNFSLLAVDRLLLGAAESFILPAMLILLTNWFTSAERSRTNTLLILGNPITMLWMSLATGYLIRAVGWRMTFILEGLPSVLWGIVWLFIIRDHPHEVSWMDAESTKYLGQQLQHEQLQLPKVAGLKAALRQPGVILLTVQYFFWSLTVYGFVLWLPSVVQSSAAQGIAMTGVISAAPYLIAIVVMLVVSHYSDKSRKRKQFIWPFLMISSAALIGYCLTAGYGFWWGFGFLIVAGAAMYAPYGPFFAVMPEILPRNVSGEVTALVNSSGALGGFAGTWLVGLLKALTGSSISGFLLMASSLTVASIMLMYIPGAPSRSAKVLTQLAAED